MAKDKKDLEVKNKYDMSALTNKQVGRIDRFLLRSGFAENKDYRINYFENKAELVLFDEQLMKEFKALFTLFVSIYKK